MGHQRAPPILLDWVRSCSLLLQRLPLLEKKYTITMVVDTAPTTHFSPLSNRRPLVVSAIYLPDASTVAIGGYGTVTAAKTLPNDDDDGYASARRDI